MSIALLTESKTRIQEATAEVERAAATLRQAQAIRTEIEVARQRAMGRVGAGDAEPLADLDELRRKYIEARHAVQDAEVALARAQKTLEAVCANHGRSEQAATAEALAEVAEVRAVFASAIEARLAELLATIRLYQAAVTESVACARLLGVSPRHAHMDAFVARRLVQGFHSVLAKEFPYTNAVWAPEPALPESDTIASESMRPAIERVKGKAPAA